MAANLVLIAEGRDALSARLLLKEADGVVFDGR